MAHTINLSSWFKYPADPIYRGDDPFNESAPSVTLSNVTSPSFDDPLSVGDVINWAAVTDSGAAVAVDSFANVTLTGTYVPGDEFTYTINAGPTQTYTLG